MKAFEIEKKSIDYDELHDRLGAWIASAAKPLRKVLILPPDATRAHSQAGVITEILYDLLAPECQVDIMPALGTHAPMSEAALRNMFGDRIPLDRFLVHRWREEVVQIGTVQEDYVAAISDGCVSYPIEVEVNKRIMDPSYDLVVSVGQVLPHEVVGMANYTKNVLVGCGGSNIINKSHYLGAAWGMERLMGQDHSPVRQVLDFVENNFLKDVPLQYILTVTKTVQQKCILRGLYVGRDRSKFEHAVALSQQENITYLEKPLKKAVVYLDPDEFKSTWLGNKAVYRTRMAMADGGELLIIAPGVKEFGEDKAIDRLIRKYGYKGTPAITKAVAEHQELRDNLSAAAHLIHGSSEGRFTITYAPGHLSEEEVRNAGFEYMDIDRARELYPPESLEDGYTRTKQGEEIFYISNPALGLWSVAQ